MAYKKSSAGPIALILVVSFVVFPFPLVDSIAKSDDEWIITIDGESLELIPELEEYAWVLERPPYEIWDKIGLHRLVKTGEEPIGVIVIFPGTSSSGEQLISEDYYLRYIAAIDADEEKVNEIREKRKSHSITHYLALRGWDVYTMDYRTHFVPNTYTQDDLKFMAEWGWKMYMEDAELVIDKVKDVSGADKVFLGGESFGGMAAMNYASMHWEEDLDGIVLLDGGTGGKQSISDMLMGMLPIEIPSLLLHLFPIVRQFVRPILELMTHLLGLYALDQSHDMGPLLNPIMTQLGVQPIPHYLEVREYALEHPLDPPLDPVTGKRLEPTKSSITGEPFDNYIEWAAGLLAESRGTTNLYEGYNDVESSANVFFRFDRYWPLQIYLELIADLLRPGYESDSGVWNRDYYNFYAHYDEIDVPLIAFISGFGLTMFGSFDPCIANPDVTGYTLEEWGHLDVYTGTYNDVMVNEPTYQWLIDRT